MWRKCIAMARPRRARRPPPAPTARGPAQRACGGLLGACVVAVSWINGFLFGCAEDVSEWLRAGRGFEAEAAYGFRSGVWWERRW